MSEAKKILIIDDEEIIRMNLEAFLEDEGFHVYLAGTGEDAIDVLKQNDDIDVAIVDIRLPGIDGDMVMLEGAKISPKLKYIIHTGSSEYIVSKELMALGITKKNILFKPLIEMNALLDLIEQLLNQDL